MNKLPEYYEYCRYNRQT